MQIFEDDQQRRLFRVPNEELQKRPEEACLQLGRIAYHHRGAALRCVGGESREEHRELRGSAPRERRERGGRQRAQNRKQRVGERCIWNA